MKFFNSAWKKKSIILWRDTCSFFSLGSSWNFDLWSSADSEKRLSINLAMLENLRKFCSRSFWSAPRIYKLSEINSFTPTRLSNVSRYSIETRSISKRMSLTSANSAVSYKFAQTMASSIHTNCVFITIFGLWAVRRLPWLKWKHKTKLANKISEPWLFDSNY